MGLQTYIITQIGEYSLDSSRELQLFVRRRGGRNSVGQRPRAHILSDDSQAHPLARHPLVGFMGPVRLNHRGVAADILQRIFAENLSKQLEVEMSGDAKPAP